MGCVWGKENATSSNNINGHIEVKSPIVSELHEGDRIHRKKRIDSWKAWIGEEAPHVQYAELDKAVEENQLMTSQVHIKQKRKTKQDRDEDFPPDLTFKDSIYLYIYGHKQTEKAKIGVLQAAYLDRYGIHPPERSRGQKTNTYKYGKGKFLVDDKIMKTNESFDHVDHHESTSKAAETSEEGEELIKGSNGNQNLFDVRFHEERVNNVVDSTRARRAFNWPKEIEEYECTFAYNQEKFDNLVENVNKKRTLTIFLSSPFVEYEEEREQFAHRISALENILMFSNIQLILIDYRTGIVSGKDNTIVKCLDSIDDCDLFIGYMGGRYGSTLKLPGNQWIEQELDTCVQEQRYSYLERYRMQSVTEMEWLHAFLHDPFVQDKHKPVSFFLFRDQSYDEKHTKNKDELESHRPFSEDLKQRIINTIHDDNSNSNYAVYADNYKDPYIGAELMYHYCKTLIEDLIERLKNTNADDNILQLHEVSEKYREQKRLQWAFLCSKVRFFVDIDPDLTDEVRAYVQQQQDDDDDDDDETDDTLPFVIHGRSGSGKSSFMANMVTGLVNDSRMRDSCRLFYHFCERHTDRQDLHGMVTRLYDEFRLWIGEDIIEKEGLDLPSTGSIQNIRSVFSTMNNALKTLAARDITLPIVIIMIDAVNELDDKRYGNNIDDIPSLMHWLPMKFSRHMRIIISCLSHSECMVNRRSALYDLLEFHPPKMIQDLNEEARAKVIRKWHEKYLKREHPHLEDLKRADQCKNALYLTMVLHYLMLHGTHATIAEAYDKNKMDQSIINKLLNNLDVVSLIRYIIEEQTGKVKIKGTDKPELLKDVLCYIYCSREGLTIEELQELTKCNDIDFWKDFEYNYKHVVSIDYLDLVHFRHASVREAVERSFLGNGKSFSELETLNSTGVVHGNNTLSASNFMNQLQEFNEITKKFHGKIALKMKEKVDKAESKFIYENVIQTTREMRELDFHERKCGMRPSVIVTVRIRPALDSEKVMDDQEVIQYTSKQVSVKHSRFERIGSSYAFNHIFPPHATQERVFQYCGKDISDQVLQGNNTAILAYGQTSSGKTYTMFGSESDPGLIIRTVQRIVLDIQDQKERKRLDWTASCRMVEVYLDNVLDLLQQNADDNMDRKVGMHMEASTTEETDRTDDNYKTVPYKVVWHGKRIKKDAEGVTGKQAANRLRSKKLACDEYGICNFSEILEIAKKNRVCRGTEMNDRSSRSHCIIMIDFILRKRNDRGQVDECRSTLHFVDLAGNEKLYRIAMDPAPGDKAKPMTKAKYDYEQLVQECKATNSSLSTLNKCIHALATDGVKHVPYRESTLTKVLQDCLGGEAKLVLIATIAGTQTNRAETLSTLANMEQAKKIANHKNKIARQVEEERQRRRLEASESHQLNGQLPDAYPRRMFRQWMIHQTHISMEDANTYAQTFIDNNIRSLKDLWNYHQEFNKQGSIWKHLQVAEENAKKIYQALNTFEEHLKRLKTDEEKNIKLLEWFKNGVTGLEAKESGQYSIGDVYDAGIKGLDLVNIGYRIKDVVAIDTETKENTSFWAELLKDFIDEKDLRHLKEAGASLSVLRACGKSDSDLIELGYSLNEIRESVTETASSADNVELSPSNFERDVRQCIARIEDRHREEAKWWFREKNSLDAVLNDSSRLAELVSSSEEFEKGDNYWVYREKEFSDVLSQDEHHIKREFFIRAKIKKVTRRVEDAKQIEILRVAIDMKDDCLPWVAKYDQTVLEVEEANAANDEVPMNDETVTKWLRDNLSANYRTNAQDYRTHAEVPYPTVEFDLELPIRDIERVKLKKWAKKNLKAFTLEKKLPEDIFSESPRELVKDMGKSTVSYGKSESKIIETNADKIDYFISHSWANTLAIQEEKKKLFEEFANQFYEKHKRWPTCWLDKYCIDQAEPGNDITVVPIYISCCTKILVLLTPSYMRRLWCIWDLFVALIVYGEEEALKRIEIRVVCDGSREHAAEALRSFEVNNSHCFSPQEEVRLREIIKFTCGFEKLESFVKQLSRKLGLGSTESSSTSTSSNTNDIDHHKSDDPISTVSDYIPPPLMGSEGDVLKVSSRSSLDEQYVNKT